MSPNNLESRDGKPFGWADTPWLVAAILGVWGVVIGLEDFLVADILASSVGILVCLRLAKETQLGKPERRTWLFVLGVIAVVIALGVDFWWTGQKRASAEQKSSQIEQLGQIPTLKEIIRQMTLNEEKAAKAQALQQGKMQQQISDIGADNKSLKTSIDKKDAVLAQIAKDQFALNFFPQVVAQTDDSKDQIKLVNEGKTNIEVRDMKCIAPDHYTLIQAGIPDAMVAPNAFTSMIANPELNAHLLQITPIDSDGRVPFDCSVSIKTLNGRNYRFPFTWVFVVKDNAVSRSYGVGHAITETK